MTGILPIARLGSPILEQRAKDIEKFADRSLQSLIDSLIETARASNGVGIAAPQVSESLRLFIVASRPNPRYPNAPTMEPTAMINPRILSTSGEIVKGWEGCLSVPGLRGFVPRHRSIEVEYLDRSGNVIRARFDDFIARIFQHESDHLDGILFLDRLESDADLYTEEEYQFLTREASVTETVGARASHP
ncbi:peptide deformylase [Pannus brasiliensis CCIBt3594]|uniref:Peptide deformylase n=1 Tax=Pannus brasiliensis CCIBt3594 TaxID=1427578 RepID=A0AAW9QVB7_9CHRO